MVVKMVIYMCFFWSCRVAGTASAMSSFFSSLFIVSTCEMLMMLVGSVRDTFVLILLWLSLCL